MAPQKNKKFTAGWYREKASFFIILLAINKKMSPKWGHKSSSYPYRTAKVAARPSPRVFWKFGGLYSDSGRLFAPAFSACANGKSGFFCPSTAAWYRWDIHSPFQLTCGCIFIFYIISQYTMIINLFFIEKWILLCYNTFVKGGNRCKSCARPSP